MSYTERDAWNDEKAHGDWPFARWQLPALALRDDFDYFEMRRYSTGIGPLFVSARSAFSTKNVAGLRQALDIAREVVECAIENAEGDAYATWLRHEVWLSVIDETLVGGNEPAELVAESLDYIGAPPGEFSEQDIYAAVALWAFGEWDWFQARKDHAMAHWALLQASIAVARVEYARGLRDAERHSALEVAERSRQAAAERHRANRENKAKGRTIWIGKEWRVQADAERAIAAACNITKEVAARWIREFKRAKA